jgi:hypothetical protein
MAALPPEVLGLVDLSALRRFASIRLSVAINFFGQAKPISLSAIKCQLSAFSRH